MLLSGVRIPVFQRLLQAVLVLCFVPLLSSSAASADTEDPKGFESFRLLVDRNVFNRNRRPILKTSDADASQPQLAAPKSSEQLALVGVLIDEFGAVAFFAGSNREFQTVVKENDSIAGFAVENIESLSVILKHDDVETALAVGESLMRVEGGEWERGGNGVFTQGGGTASKPEDSAEATVEGSDAMDDIRKRMMERRRKEATP